MSDQASLFDEPRAPRPTVRRDSPIVDYVAGVFGYRRYGASPGKAQRERATDLAVWALQKVEELPD